MPEELEEHWHDFRRSLARRGRSGSTMQVYRKSFEQFWKWALDNDVKPDPSVVDHTIINDWTDHMLRCVVLRNGRQAFQTDPKTGERTPVPLSSSTRRIRYTNLRPFFSWYAKEYDAPNPFDRADAPSAPDSAPIPVVPLDDVRSLVTACAGKDFLARRDQAIVLVLFDTGARLGELLALTLDDWDQRRDLLTLRGKTGTRVVPISPTTGEAISRYVKRARREHPKSNLSALWLAGKGPLTSSGVAQLLRRRCEQAGIPNIHPHQARHTFSHEFRVMGGSEGDLLMLAGWKSPSMAHRYGRSAAAERAQESLRRLSLADRLEL